MQPIETFNDIESKSLQAYNRLMVSLNLNQRVGTEAVEKYLGQFSEQDRVRIFAMGASIHSKGKLAVQRDLGIGEKEDLH